MIVLIGEAHHDGGGDDGSGVAVIFVVRKRIR